MENNYAGRYGQSKNRLGAASCVLGVLGIAFLLIMFVQISALMSLGALLLGLVGLRRKPRTSAVIGIVLGGVPLALTAFAVMTLVTDIQAASG